MKAAPVKQIEIVAGPNGSGKSTFAQAYFGFRNGESRFINADIVASGLSSGNKTHTAFHAGRVVLKAIEDAIAAGESFAFESTLSGLGWQPLLRKAKSDGYIVTIYFVYLEKPSLNLRRIKQRVSEGGHFIPRDTVLRRYPRSINNFWNIYRPLSDNWFIFENSGPKPKQVHFKSQYDASEPAAKLKFERSFLRGRR